MILIDLNQVMISNLMKQIGQNNNQLDENLIRHMVLNSLRMYNVKFKDEYGDIVICADDKQYWRRDFFPYYKAGRKKSREESPLDWNLIFETLNKVRDEIRENFPYVVIQIPKAEADDIIGALCHRYGVELASESTEKILIISSDKDFRQLQKYANVYQYSPMDKKFLVEKNPERFLQEHIIRGDTGDGVPNFLSCDNTFVIQARQKPITEKKLNTFIGKQPEDFCDEVTLQRYRRNEQLIDLSKIPDNIQFRVYEAYDSTPKRGKEKLLNYFIKHRMKLMVNHIQEF